MGRPDERDKPLEVVSEGPRIDLAGLAIGAAPPFTQSVTIEGIEVSQAIQNMDHQVPLIAGRRTVVRVYFSVKTDQGFGQISGRLLVQPAGNPVMVDPAVQSISVLDQWNGNMDSFKRMHIETSLNFVLPDFLTSAGSCTISVLQVLDMYHDRATVPCTNAATLTRTA